MIVKLIALLAAMLISLSVGTWNTGLRAEPKPTARPTQKPAVRHTVAEARTYARRVLGAREYSCIDRIFEYESHWNPRAQNRRSGAYGIPQALPGSRMRTAGKDWRTNPITQVKWGISYVKGRYGGACNALDHIRSHGWY